LARDAKQGPRQCKYQHLHDHGFGGYLLSQTLHSSIRIHGKPWELPPYPKPVEETSPLVPTKTVSLHLQTKLQYDLCDRFEVSIHGPHFSHVVLNHMYHKVPYHQHVDHHQPLAMVEQGAIPELLQVAAHQALECRSA
jgi:hypothetical protein